MWFSRISKLATSSISRRFTYKNHPTLTQNAGFSSLVDSKSPSISSKYGYTNYPKNLYLVKHYHNSGVDKWYKNIPKRTLVGFASPKRISFLLFSLLTGLVIVKVYDKVYDHSEKIPYTNRTHIVFAPSYFDKIVGDVFLHQIVPLKILSEQHPDSIRVKRIGEQIVKALESDLKAMKNENVSVDHLGGLIWEFVVVDSLHCGKILVGTDTLKELKVLKSDADFDTLIRLQYLPGGAGYLPGGKILVSTNLLKELKSDADIATIIGHQVGHIVARHGANAMNMTILAIQIKGVFGLAKPEKWIPTFLKYPKRQSLASSSRQESEADHIGLLVMASAGYDPQAAPKVYEILEKYESSESDIYHMHTSAKKRAEKLARGEVMKEASSIYSKVIETRKMNGLKDR